MLRCLVRVFGDRVLTFEARAGNGKTVGVAVFIEHNGNLFARWIGLDSSAIPPFSYFELLAYTPIEYLGSVGGGVIHLGGGRDGTLAAKIARATRVEPLWTLSFGVFGPPSAHSIKGPILWG
jgi:hypothetical protein